MIYITKVNRMFNIDEKSDFEKNMAVFQKSIDEKDPVYLNKVINSIKKVIGHFQHDSLSFEGLSPELILEFNKHSDISYIMRESMNPNFKFSKHTFSFKGLSTNFIYMPKPFLNLFSQYNSNNSCEVTFKENGDLEGVQFRSKMRSNHSKTVVLTYDDNLKLNSISRSYIINNKPSIKNLFTTVKSYCESEADELYFLTLFLKDADQVAAVLPEFSIPSAYDFTSDVFKQQLLVAEMLLS